MPFLLDVLHLTHIMCYVSQDLRPPTLTKARRAVRHHCRLAGNAFDGYDSDDYDPSCWEFCQSLDEAVIAVQADSKHAVKSEPNHTQVCPYLAAWVLACRATNGHSVMQVPQQPVVLRPGTGRADGSDDDDDGFDHDDGESTLLLQGRSAAAGGWVRQRSPVWRRTVGRQSAATLVPRAAGAAVNAQAADGDWSFEDDDDYQLLDPLDLPEAHHQIAAETLVCKSSLSPHHALIV